MVRDAVSGSRHAGSGPRACFVYRRTVHLRPPSIDRGITSFLWALGLGVFVWIGSRAVGVDKGTAFLLGVISFGAIFLFVRTHGEDV